MPLSTTSHPITVFRVMLGIQPAAIIGSCIYLATFLGDLWPLALAPVPFLVLGIGYFDGQLSLHQQRIDSSGEKPALWRWAFLFSLFQLVIAPAFLVLIFFGVWAISGMWKP